MNKLTPQQSAVLSDINDLIIKNDNDRDVKEALYRASETYLNSIEMATQEEKKVGIWAILAPVLTELGKEGIEWLEAKLSQHKAAMANTESCNGVAMPTQPPQGHALGHYYCTKDGWQWEDEIG